LGDVQKPKTLPCKKPNQIKRYRAKNQTKNVQKIESFKTKPCKKQKQPCTFSEIHDML
jgi:hypothetical protein